jgi:hypothetical protein
MALLDISGDDHRHDSLRYDVDQAFLKSVGAPVGDSQRGRVVNGKMLGNWEKSLLGEA